MVSDTNDKFNEFKPRMQPNAIDQLNMKRTILISLSFFTVLMAWSYFNLIVPTILDEILRDMDSIVAKQTVKGIILALDNMIAVIVQPFFGHMSDRTCSKLGRRMPYIIAGTFLAAFFFSVIPFVRVLSALVIIIFLFDFSMAIFRSVSIAILPDYTPDKFRSKASAVQQFIANMGGVIAFGIPMIIKLFGVPEEIGPNQTNPLFNQIGFISISILMIIAVIIQILVVKETPTSKGFFKLNQREIQIDPITFQVCEQIDEKEHDKKAIPIFQQIKQVFKAEDKSFRNMLFVVLFAYTGFAAVEAFFSTFAIDYLGKSKSITGTLFMAYSVPMILTAYYWGKVGQRIGRRKAARNGLIGVIIFTSIMAIVLVPLLHNPKIVKETYFTWADILVMINLALISMPWMCFIVNSFPIIWSLAPEGKVGTYTGVYYAFNQFAYSISPILAGINLDFFRDLGEKQYLVLFPMVLFCMIISLLFMMQVKKGDADLSPEKIEEYEQKYGDLD